MSRSFSVRCKRCGTTLETAIQSYDFQREPGKGNRKPTIQCPRCKLAATYDAGEFFSGQ